MNPVESWPNDEVPILTEKHYTAPSVFDVANLMREARRQKHLPHLPIPAICVLDPDGDLVDYLRATNQSEQHPGWACYHTTLDVLHIAGTEVGIVGRVVGASFAVLVAEELFVSGCKLLISITSAGQIRPLAEPPYFMLIERALRDEGTSYHYLPPSAYAALAPALHEQIIHGWNRQVVALVYGASWTTDAPFRETEAMISRCHTVGIAAVEMEAAALYALAQAKGYAIICFAHITNTMATAGDDFEKGPDQGSHAMIQLLSETIACMASA